MLAMRWLGLQSSSREGSGQESGLILELRSIGLVEMGGRGKEKSTMTPEF